jgi:hypothetical protein
MGRAPSLVLGGTRGPGFLQQSPETRRLGLCLQVHLDTRGLFGPGQEVRQPWRLRQPCRGVEIAGVLLKRPRRFLEG